jgi:hypothetical protein
MSSLWWTDPAALSATLDRLGVGAAAGAGVRLGALPGLGLVAGAVPVSLHAAVSPEPSSAGPEALVPPAPQRGRAVLPFTPPPGELGERLDAYLEWLAAAVGGRRPFVADRDGLPLAGEASEHDFMAIGSAVTRLMQRISDRSGQRLGAGVLLDVAGERLQLVLVETDLGLFTVGAVVADPVTPDVLARLEDGLRAALAD